MTDISYGQHHRVLWWTSGSPGRLIHMVWRNCHHLTKMEELFKVVAETEPRTIRGTVSPCCPKTPNSIRDADKLQLDACGYAPLGPRKATETAGWMKKLLGCWERFPNSAGKTNPEPACCLFPVHRVPQTAPPTHTAWMHACTQTCIQT